MLASNQLNNNMSIAEKRAAKLEAERSALEMFGAEMDDERSSPNKKSTLGRNARAGLSSTKKVSQVSPKATSPTKKQGPTPGSAAKV